ncbi:MAG: BamA/TamA family outer membrane protein [Armatimonadaceae bacterium]
MFHRAITTPVCLTGLVCLVASVPAFAQEGQVIGSVEIQGVQNTNPEIVRLALADAGLKEGQVFRNSAISDARQRILDKGYYNEALIRADLTTDNRVRVLVEVFENPRINDIRLKGNDVIPSEQILPFLASKPGTVINNNTLRQDVQRIQRIYRTKGYEAFIAELEGDEVFDPRTNTLTFTIIETVVDSIEVRGLGKTRKFVVTREMRTKPGETLNFDVLQRDAQRIFNTGLFGNVLRPQVEPVALGRVKLVMSVEEQRTGQVQVGFGYSPQQRLTGTVEISEQNFQGRGQGLAASWTVGGNIARNQYELSFTEPWIDKNNTSLGINLYDRFNFRFNRILSNNATSGTNNNQYFELRRGGAITLSRPVSEFGRVFGSVRTEAVRANNLQPDYNQLNNDQINSIRGALVQSGDVLSYTMRYLLNTRDNEQDPATGLLFSPTVEFGNSTFEFQKPFINPDYISPEITPNVQRVLIDDRRQSGAFTKLNLDFRRYINLGPPRQDLRDPRKVLATRLLLGTSLGNISFSEQYFMGGADNLRGYFDDRFWGNNLFLLSTELRIPFDRSGTLTGVTFLDIGDAWGASEINQENIPGFGQHQGFAPRIGVGVGVRFRTPVGPIRLDLGFGETTRTHFSIGQAF